MNNKDTCNNSNNNNVEPYDVIIVGGGLSGLVIARNLDQSQNHIKWKLLEANDRLGGRLQNDVTGKIDLGAAWVWPQHQRQMTQLCQSLGIDYFPQPDDPTSFRVVGGTANIIHRLAEELSSSYDNLEEQSKKNVDSNRIELKSPVVACRMQSNNTVSVELGSGEMLYARYVVFACPPKLIHLNVRFHPSLSESKIQAMLNSQTWMAGVTKVALVYNKPKFWSVYESNGSLQPGYNRPAFQVYDASPEDGSVSALTFFTLASLSGDENNDEKLARDCADQMYQSLSRKSLLNDPEIESKIKSYDALYVKRWPREKYISEDPNPRGINPHPRPVLELAKSDWGGKLLFAGTESDLLSPGVMEGAVNAAFRVTAELRKELGRTIINKILK